ncbi:hypothetical protein Pla111_33380 [Botrimarina hoheduenensis]|uniref:Tc1-like transposase DDE domain-containing protein n=1 Tax=Botrimarina hoheduenensis TaxID=2528000 RepID=A0A5C5VRK6_9BACT|nr:transposase [Botrimarina hoheduenensis]TWT40693.1 hypothetical protein Pla111_33380 [Botrimarina hoheduenensis]
MAERFGFDPSSAKRWRSAWREGGEDTLAAKPPPIGKCMLTDAQLDELVELVVAGPHEALFPTNLWTCTPVAKLTRDCLSVEYNRRLLAKLLHQLGYQDRRTPGRSPANKTTRPLSPGVGRVGEDQTRARREGANIIFLDETGFMLQPVNRRSRTPCCSTQVQNAWDRSDRLSVIGASVLSPTITRFLCCFDIARANVKAGDAVELLRPLRRLRRKNVCRPRIVVSVRWSVHRAVAKKIARLGWKHIAFESLPAYCLELNPVEALWSHAKYADLGNIVPDAVWQLDEAVNTSLNAQAHNHRRKLSFFLEDRSTQAMQSIHWRCDR